MTTSSRRHAPPPRSVPPPAGAQPSVHARFIPREELSSFTAWSPGPLAGGTVPNASLRRATDKAPPASNDGGSADALAAQLRAARQSGYQDGYRDGLAALEAFKQAYAGQVTAQLGGLTEGYQRELDGLQQQIAQAVAVAATQVARQVVRSELTARPELIAAVAHEAIDTLLTTARHITLRVHPDDHGLVARGTGDALAARGARLVADPTLRRGGCELDSDIGAVDASLQTRWERAAAALGCEARWDAEPAATAAAEATNATATDTDTTDAA